MNNFLLLASLVVTQVLGDMWLSRAMKGFEATDPFAIWGLESLVVHALTSFWIWLGAGTLVLSLFLYFVAVSRLDLSYVLPIHATQYILNALFARTLLGESVSIVRWLSASVITVGVFLVGASENPASFARADREKPYFSPRKWFDRFFLFLVPVTFSAARFWLSVLVIALSDSAGDLSNTIGMRQIGAVKINSPSSLVAFVRKVLANGNILRGVVFQSIAFFTFLSILSWADISLVRPATASGYVTTLLGARFILHEQIEPGRLLGIVIVGIGVGLVGLDGSL